MSVSFFDFFILTISPFLIASFIFMFREKLPAELNSSGGRYLYIEPLRGIAASLVVVCHSFLSYNFFISSKWSPVSNFVEYSNPIVLDLVRKMGGIGVIIFFMITSFLFFDKILKSSGRLDVKTFFISRFFRIVPLYLFVVSIGLVIVLFTGLNSIVGIKDISKSVLSWFSFGLMDMASISSVIPHGLIFAGVFWTLAIEWKFYLILPALSAFYGRISSVIFISLAFVLTCIFNYIGVIDKYIATTLLCFIMGMVASLTVNNYISIPKRMLTALSVISVVLMIYFVSTNRAIYKIEPVIFLGLVFIFICNGFSLFGILKLKSLSYLGVISYSLYLIHGLSYFLMNGFLNVKGSFVINSIISITISIMLSSVTYLFIEHKSIIFGKKIGSKFKNDN